MYAGTEMQWVSGIKRALVMFMIALIENRGEKRKQKPQTLNINTLKYQLKKTFAVSRETLLLQDTRF